MVAPEAIKAVVLPGQTDKVVALTVKDGTAPITVVTVATAVQPLTPVTVTDTGPAGVQLVIAVKVDPVLQVYVPPPDAVNVVQPEQITVAPLIAAAGFGFTTIVIVFVPGHG